jgi:carboxyl-terminal processing protease
MEKQYVTYVRINPFQLGVAFVMVFIVGFLLGNQITIIQAQTNTTPSNNEDVLAPVYQAYSYIQESYITPIEDEVLINGAIEGMTNALQDPFSAYLAPDLNERFNESLAGDMEGIGATIRTIPETGEIEIVNTLPNTPARAVGLQAGDIFYAVNGESVVGLDQLELLPLVRGKAGTSVTITFLRGDELVEVTIIRERFDVPTVEYERLPNDIGYIYLVEFNARSREQLDAALDDLDVNNLNALVIDLRGNPGGLLTSAIEVTSAFLPDGAVLYEVFGDGSERIFQTDGSFYGVTVPVVLLVDRGSASAAELFAGAMQDRGLATIVGDVTFGKGSVQVIHQLINGGGLRVTVARWLTPLRNSIDTIGVTPDILVPITEDFDFQRDGDIQLQAALDYIYESLGIEPVEAVQTD